MVYFVLFDMMDGFYEEQKILMTMRYLVPLGLFILFSIKYGCLKYSDTIFYVLLAYLFILLLFTEGDFIISTKNTLSFLIALYMIMIGRRMAAQEDVIEKFEPYNRFIMIALPLYIVYANIFNVGESYSEAFTTGFLITSRMYIFPIVLFLSIHYILSNKKTPQYLKAVDILLIVLNICIIIINTRRTAIGMLFFGLIIYAALNPTILLKMSILLLVFIGGLVVSYPLYEEMLTAQMEERERISNVGTYDQEGRYLETLYLIDFHYRKQDLNALLFGVKLFDSKEFGTQYFGRTREIHSDFNMIIYSTGLVGFILFGLFFVYYFLVGNMKIESESKKLYAAFLIMFCIILIPGRFIGTFTYAPLLMFLLGATKWAIPHDKSESMPTPISDDKWQDINPI